MPSSLERRQAKRIRELETERDDLAKQVTKLRLALRAVQSATDDLDGTLVGAQVAAALS